MNKQFTPLNYLIFLFCGILFLVNSCKKDTSQDTVEATLTDIKEWYNQNHAKSTSSMFAGIPDWNSATQSVHDGYNITELLLTQENRIVLKSSDSASKTSTSIKLVFLNPVGTKTIHAAYMMVSGDSKQNLTGVKYKSFEQFTGKIIYYNFNEIFNNGYIINGGKIEKALSKPALSAVQLLDLHQQKYYSNPAPGERLMLADGSSNCSVLTYEVQQQVCLSVSFEATYATKEAGMQKLMTGNGDCWWQTIGYIDVLSCSPGTGNESGGIVGDVGGTTTGTTSTNEGQNANNAPEIENNIEKPCVKNAVDNLLKSTNGLRAKMADILNSFIIDKNFIQIDVVGGSTPNGTAGSTIHQGYNPNTKVYDAVIQLDTDSQFDGSSEEYIASVLIHEIGHAYIGYMNALGNNLVNGNVLNNNHEYMSNNYVKPIATFLQQTYGLTDAESIALAWAGVSNSTAYIENNTFSYGLLGQTMTKSTMESIITQFITGQKGLKVCNSSN